MFKVTVIFFVIKGFLIYHFTCVSCLGFIHLIKKRGRIQLVFSESSLTITGFCECLVLYHGYLCYLHYHGSVYRKLNLLLHPSKINKFFSVSAVS